MKRKCQLNFRVHFVIVVPYLVLNLIIFNIVFFYLIFSTSQPILGNYQGDIVILPMSITAFCLCLIWRTPEPPNNVRSLMFHFYTHWKLRNGKLAWNWYGIVLLLLTLSWFSIYRQPFFCNTKKVGIFALFIIAWNLIKNWVIISVNGYFDLQADLVTNDVDLEALSKS